MKTPLILRAPFVLAAALAALSASAVPFRIESSGQWSTWTSGANASLRLEIDSQVGGYTALETVEGYYDLSDRYGYVHLANDDPYGFVDIFIRFQAPVATGVDTLTYTGTWEPYGYGDGYYSFPTGSGTAVMTTVGTDRFRQASLTLDGNIQAVPEPASMAALGLGALGLLRRRTPRA